MEKIRLVVTNKDCTPVVGSEQAAGIDLRMNVRTAAGFTPFMPGDTLHFGTGVKMAIPEGWVGLVMPRSGLGFKYRVRLDNTVGVIDSDYRGEIMVKITNCGKTEYMLEDFERVCQMVIVPHYKVYDNLEFVDDLADTERGSSGFGHSGRQ